MWLKILAGAWTVAKQTGLDKKVKNWILNRVKKSTNKYDDKVVAGLELIKKIYDDEEA